MHRETHRTLKSKKIIIKSLFFYKRRAKIKLEKGRKWTYPLIHILSTFKEIIIWCTDKAHGIISVTQLENHNFMSGSENSKKCNPAEIGIFLNSRR